MNFIDLSEISLLVEQQPQNWTMWPNGFDLRYVGPVREGKMVGSIPCYVKNCAYMFYGRTDLVYPPSIPEGVAICDYMFYGCASLKEPPVLPKGVVTCYDAFSGCSSMRNNVIISDNVITYDYMIGAWDYLAQPYDPLKRPSFIEFQKFALKRLEETQILYSYLGQELTIRKFIELFESTCKLEEQKKSFGGNIRVMGMDLFSMNAAEAIGEVEKKSEKDTILKRGCENTPENKRGFFSTMSCGLDDEDDENMTN